MSWAFRETSTGVNWILRSGLLAHGSHAGTHTHIHVVGYGGGRDRDARSRRLVHFTQSSEYTIESLERGMGFEPMNNGFAGRRVSHFATRTRLGLQLTFAQKHKTHCALAVGSTET